MGTKEEELSTLRRIIENSGYRLAEDFGAEASFSEDASVIPTELMILAKRKFEAVLNELGLGEMEIKEITLRPRGDIYPQAGFSICCKNCKCHLC